MSGTVPVKQLKSLYAKIQYEFVWLSLDTRNYRHYWKGICVLAFIL
jgi:hypothetical protein